MSVAVHSDDPDGTNSRLGKKSDLVVNTSLKSIDRLQVRTLLTRKYNMDKPTSTTSIVRGKQLRELITTFIYANIACVVIFWVWRWAIMSDDSHFIDVHAQERPLSDSAFITSGYLSIMTQTTVGAADITPISLHSRVLTSLQALSAIGSIIVIAIAITNPPVDTRQH